MGKSPNVFCVPSVFRAPRRSIPTIYLFTPASSGWFSALRLHVSIVQLASAVNVLVCYEWTT